MKAAAHFAGQFYPERPEELEETVRQMIDAAVVAPETAGRAVGAMVPHAGYVYSGPTAATAYRALGRQAPGVVVLLGPSHRESVGPARVVDVDRFETPGGEMTCDREGASRLANAAGIELGPPLAEHSLEVQLPFVRHQFPLAAVICVAMGWPDPETARGLGEALVQLGPASSVMVLASSDLSHYHSAAQARVLDQRFREVLESGDGPRLFREWEAKRVEACGLGAILTLLDVARRRRARLQVLAQCDSSQAFGDTERVVGYLSAIALCEDAA